MTGWERLLTRQLPTRRVLLPLDPAGYQAAAAAGQPLDGLPVLAFEVSALPPAVWEDLVDQHPPTADQVSRGWAWDPATLRGPALALAVTLDGDDPLTADQWDGHIKAGRLSSGELDALFGTVVELNARAPQVSMGKDSG